jgi:uncharacterized protein involved in outer membrane biogenesis
MSLVHNTENTHWAGLRERIVADFRDFRFSWAGFFRWTCIVIAAVLFAFVVTLYFLDWNQMRGPIGRYASARYGREVRIDGDLKVDLFRRQPHISVDGLYIGNPTWAGGKQAARLDHAEIEFRLFPAFAGHLLLPLVRVERPAILLLRDSSGRTNWDSSARGASAAWQIPPIQHLTVVDGHVEIDDAVRKLKFIGTVSSEERAGENGGAFILKGAGTLNGNQFLADAHGGPLIHVDESKPYALQADIRAGDTHAIIDGAIDHPFHLDRFQAQAQFSGSNLADLYDLTGLAMPGTPAYRLSGALRRDGDFYSFTGIAGEVGKSDLSGYLSVDASGRLPDLRGHLSSRVLDFDDLGALFRGGKIAPAQDTWLLPDIPLHTEKLRQLNGEVDYQADAIRSREFPLRGLATHVSVQNAVLTLKPLAFSFTEGKLSGAVTIDARKDVPLTSVDARITDIHVEHFIKATDKPLTGMVEARAKLTGSGSSVHKVASSASGTATLVIPSGQIRRSLAAWLGVNLLDALGLSLSGDRSNTGVRCAIVDFAANHGQLQTRRFVLDTDPVRIDGHGSVNLKDETMDLTLQGQPKSFQLVRLKAPITVSGKLDAPQLGVDLKPAVTQGALGAGLALLFPPAALFAFIDPGLAKDENCAAALSDAKAQGAPVKAGAVSKAAASDAAAARK